MDNLNVLDIFKALSNETRLNILKWLREPEKNFPAQQEHLPKEVSIEGGVCVGDIQEKVNLSQSTVSHYLSLMQKAGLLEAVRYGQWTYYRRNEETLTKIAKFINEEI